MEAVILTKSRMYGNSCVTAYNPDMNRFVRFVTDMQGSPVPKWVSKHFSLLDIVSVNVLRPCPLVPQTENLLIDPNSFCVIDKYQPGIEEIYHMISPPPPFSSFVEHPGATLRFVSRYDHSLELVRVSNLYLYLKKNSRGELRVKADFRYNCFEEQNEFSVTDGVFENAVKESSNGSLKIGDAYVMVSIPTQPFENGEFYKFIAAIYPVI